MPQDVLCRVGGREFHLPIEYPPKVVVEFASDFSACNVIIEGETPKVFFDALMANNKCDEKSLWEEFEPKLNPEIESSFGPLGDIPGQKIHEYTLNKNKYEIYYSDCSGSMIEYAKRMQLLFAVLGPEDGCVMTSFEDSTCTHCYLTIEKSSSSWCVIGWAAADEAYHYPDKTQLIISQLLILPSWQKCGHGSVLAASIWESTKMGTMPEIDRIMWAKPSEDGEQQERVQEDPERFTYALHLCRMLSMDIFTEFTDTSIINIDSYQGDRSATDWQKIRISKQHCDERKTPPIQQLQWSRRSAIQAAQQLQISVPLVRMLFEINLLRTSRGKYAESIQHFIQRRIYNMEIVDLSRIDPNMVPHKMRALYRETFSNWKTVTKRAQGLIEKKILPGSV